MYANLISNPQDRAKALRPIMESMGGNLERYYYDGSENSIYTISEMPDVESLAALMSAVFAGAGLISYKVTPILTAPEMVEAFKKAGSVAYQPPSA